MIIDRILKIIELEEINKNQFYIKTGLSNGFLDKVKDIGGTKIEQILKVFPNISPEWLLTGKGSMVRRSNEDEALRLRITELEELNDLLRFKISVLEEAAERVKKEKKID